LWREDRQVLGFIKLPPAAGIAAEFLFHPAMLDACFQAILGFRDVQKESEGRVLALPVAIDRLRFFRQPAGAVYARAEAVSYTPTKIVSNISVIDEAGELVAAIDGLRCRLVPLARKREVAAGPSLYRERWIELAKIELLVQRLEATPDKTWLILADRAGIAEQLARTIIARGGRSVLVFRGSRMQRLG